MNKQAFLALLRQGLSGSPQDDIEERLTFYSEMIDDRIEEGLSEEEAVSAVGSASEIVTQVTADISLRKIAKDRTKPKRRLRGWEVALLALGSPIWLSLGIAAITVILSLYISVWSVIFSLWAVFGCLIGCCLGAMIPALVFVCNGNLLRGAAMAAAGMVFAGLSIFMFFGCKASTKGILMLTKKSGVWIKRSFTKKEEA